MSWQGVGARANKIIVKKRLSSDKLGTYAEYKNWCANFP